MASPLNCLDSILLEYSEETTNIEQEEVKRNRKGDSPCLKSILISPPATGHLPSLLKPANSTYNYHSIFLHETAGQPCTVSSKHKHNPLIWTTHLLRMRTVLCLWAHTATSYYKLNWNSVYHWVQTGSWVRNLAAEDLCGIWRPRATSPLSLALDPTKLWSLANS